MQAPREAARAFLERIYGRYLDEHAPPLLWSDTDAASVFEPALAAAIVKDSDDAGRRGGISDLLDYDPFVVGQDYQISGLTIDVVRATGRSAGARVRFRNLGRPLEIQFDLTSLRGEWRIRDMRREGWSLRSLYGLKD